MTKLDEQLALAPRAMDAASNPPDERLAHLVLKSDWPIALCGAAVSERFGTGAPARDRCPHCLKLALARGLGRPGWA